MKRIVLIGLLVMGWSMTAQTTNPTYEKVGDLVKATFFHENGEVAQTGFYLDTKLHGEWKMYNKQGDKIAMGTYKEGAKSGKWFFWEGEALKEVDYISNKIAAIRQWDSKGTVVLNK
ncbi:MAG: nicotinic acid mononucleotide adenyltransferase [Flavobacteriia bacterium]|nr:nicotinic acid mononucleotide adenyltransferase [Flavobacteriia bacterium]